MGYITSEAMCKYMMFIMNDIHRQIKEHGGIIIRDGGALANEIEAIQKKFQRLEANRFQPVEYKE